LKGIAILMVVVIHTEPFLAISSTKADWYYLGHFLQQVSSFAVPFFFVAAGYFFSNGTGREQVFSRWWRYTSRLSVLLGLWIIIDGIFWGNWLGQIIETGSLSPLFWNLTAIPSFAAKHPELFFLRGTAVPLWFLISLLMAIGVLALFIRYSISANVLLAIGFVAYVFTLTTSFYADSAIGFGLTLPLEQRGPFIAFAFLTVGHYISERNFRLRYTGWILLLATLLVFLESMSLSYYGEVAFQERPYLFMTLPLSASGLLFALHNPAFGAETLISRIGNHSLGMYLTHTPVLGALEIMRSQFASSIWEIFFPLLIVVLSYWVVQVLLKTPYA